LTQRPGDARRERGSLGKALGRIFPERQILIRENGRMRYFVLGTAQQMVLVTALIGVVPWAVIATAAYVDGTKTLAKLDRRMADLNVVHVQCQTALSQIDGFQATFTGITGEVATIQDSFLRLAEHGVGPTSASMAPPRAEEAPPAAAPAHGPEIGDPAQIRQRIARLDDALSEMKASHRAFLQHSANIASQRIEQLERAMTSVGLDVSAKADKPQPTTAAAMGRGGPFVPVTLANAAPDTFDPAAFLTNRIDRLDNLSQALAPLPFSAPLTHYEVSSPFGVRNDPINVQTGVHEGVDLVAPADTPVLATGNGVVIWAGRRDRYGNLVELDHGLGLHTRYAHLSRILVGVGDSVQRGAPVGLLGDTGRSTGPHLHYEVRRDDEATNPMKFIAAGRDVLKEP
jgi:murein DD-endopeptidase MepM/ murein hydrolase activator NlpD